MPGRSQLVAALVVVVGISGLTSNSPAQTGSGQIGGGGATVCRSETPALAMGSGDLESTFRTSLRFLGSRFASVRGRIRLTPPAPTVSSRRQAATR